MFFDYSVTLSREVELFWYGRTVNGATVLFLANRYLTLVYYGFNTVVEFMLPDLSSAKVSVPLVTACPFSARQLTVVV